MLVLLRAPQKDLHQLPALLDLSLSCLFLDHLVPHHLARATEVLEACILHLPVTLGARADMDMLKKAIYLAIDVMHTVASFICLLLYRAEGTNCLVSELANVAAQERALLDECGDLLASTVAVQVEEKSLITHLMQLKQTLREEALFNGSACVILPSDTSLTTTYKMSSYS
ncbi:hypothetical protein GIB67_012257 [Kingdonia uniflora]|uniref:Uncharacterized protein n=1 Tax=Kingdonia uniflora TaxID=39325 RepID=A0A7J7M936_9MAGN|nr:hypothetical protein GIB67_012257 [Kingdonia uniflora]